LTADPQSAQGAGQTTFVTSATYPAFLLRKFAPDGSPIFAKAFAIDTSPFPIQMAHAPSIASSSEILYVGRASQRSALSANPGLFVAHLTSGGDLVSSTSHGEPYIVYPAAARSPRGTLILGGSLWAGPPNSGSMTFGGVMITTGNNLEPFVASVSP
jgi:hypothetical protein